MPWAERLDDSSDVAHDVQFMRNRVIGACKKKGLVLAVRQAITVFDDDAERCSRCYDSVYKDATYNNCPVCYGTGFTGGFREATTTWGTLAAGDNRDSVEMDSKVGESYGEKATGYLCYTPRVQADDLVATVIEYDDAGAVTIGDIYQITGNVSHETIRGRLTYHRKGETDDEDRVLIVQGFSAFRIADDDIRRELSFR